MGSRASVARLRGGQDFLGAALQCIALVSTACGGSTAGPAAPSDLDPRGDAPTETPPTTEARVGWGIHDQGVGSWDEVLVEGTSEDSLAECTDVVDELLHRAPRDEGIEVRVLVSCQPSPLPMRSAPAWARVRWTARDRELPSVRRLFEAMARSDDAGEPRPTPEAEPPEAPRIHVRRVEHFSDMASCERRRDLAHANASRSRQASHEFALELRATATDRERDEWTRECTNRPPPPEELHERDTYDLATERCERRQVSLRDFDRALAEMQERGPERTPAPAPCRSL